MKKFRNSSRRPKLEEYIRERNNVIFSRRITRKSNIKNIKKKEIAWVVGFQICVEDFVEQMDKWTEILRHWRQLYFPCTTLKCNILATAGAKGIEVTEITFRIYNLSFNIEKFFPKFLLKHQKPIEYFTITITKTHDDWKDFDWNIFDIIKKRPKKQSKRINI